MPRPWAQCCLVMIVAGACAPDELAEPQPVSSAAQRLLGRGINLGNMLEAPREGDWGARVEPHYLPAIRAAGFDSVRIPIRWSAHAETTPPYRIDEAFAARIDEVVDGALAADLAVVLNVHHYLELYEDPAGHHARLLALWRQIAERHASRPRQVMFELLNEPHGELHATRWNELLADALAVVRQSNPDRAVVVGPARYNAIDELPQLRLPEDDNLIVSVHFYRPFWLTHSGAPWLDDPPAAGAVWEGDDEQRAAVRQQLRAAAAWSERQAIPIYVSEFGTYRRAEHPSRVRWTREVVGELERQGLAWAYWGFCAGFGVYDEQADLWRDELLGALLADAR